MNISESDFIKFVEGEPGWLADMRKKSFEKIKSLPDPQHKHGLNIIIKPTIDLEELKPTTGVVGAKTTGVGTSITSEPTEHDVALFTNDSWKCDDKIAAFTSAFAKNIFYIHIPDGEQETAYVEYEANASSSVRIFVLAEGKGHIIIRKKGNPQFLGEEIRVIAKPLSNVKITSLQSLGPDVTHFQSRESQTQGNASVIWSDLILGSSYTKSDIQSNLEEGGAESKIKVLYLGTDKQRSDIYTASVHKSEHTTSDIVTKGVLNDQAKALSRGLVRINENAANSAGYETQDALLLTKDAEADAIPNLEINNHDVKCSHGSTVGQIDEEKLFYLMTRGLSEIQAKKKIVEGYFLPVLEQFDEQTREEIMNQIDQAIEA